jgi:hypothetical protein
VNWSGGRAISSAVSDLAFTWLDAS